MAECQNVKPDQVPENQNVIKPEDVQVPKVQLILGQTGQNTPTKRTDKIDKPILKDKPVKMIFRIKCNLYGNTLGHHVARWKNSGEVISNYITIFLPRVSLVCNRTKLPFDDVFSHVMSHEIIHYLVFKYEGVAATGGFDKIKDQNRWFKEDRYMIGAGLPIKRNEFL
ncbi:MAG: hypothetical protein EHM34_00275 [Nitrosopumilales archaeon]|nr:MAG: hypothetical protein EHM34_00275 [Nitrosopumilales archaeon]